MNQLIIEKITNSDGKTFINVPADIEILKQLGVAKKQAEQLVKEAITKQIRSEINAQRDEKIESSFEFQGKQIQSSLKDLIKIMSAVVAAQSALIANQPFHINWVTGDNSEIKLDAMGVIAMHTHLLKHIEQTHLKALEEKAKLQQKSLLNDSIQDENLIYHSKDTHYLLNQEKQKQLKEVIFNATNLNEPKLTREEMQTQIKEIIANAIKQTLDAKAREYADSNITSADFFQQKATELANYSSEYWSQASKIEKDYLAGNRKIPTIKEVMAELPQFK